MSVRIEDYGLIGDCETAALVSRLGSIDWLCLPRFDSAACFAALLGTPEHGRWLLTPADEILEIRRRYRPDTLILETDYRTATGEVTVVDCMPPRDVRPDLVRLVLGRSGQVRMRTELVFRFDYGSVVPWVRRTEAGLHAVAGPDAVLLETPIRLQGKDLKTRGEFDVAAGDRIPFAMVWYPSHETRPEPIHVEQKIQDAERWWQEWSGRCTYQGPWADAVRRSLITLKALTYAPTGGIVAAPTTSLPEFIGGQRNWDYRFCWVRDATFTLYSLVMCGYIEEARDWREWLLRAAAGDPSQLNIMYGVTGNRRLTELELDWLPGYENSRPVRIGNAAYSQRQLDVFGEIMDALHLARRAGMEPDENAWRLQLALSEFLETGWKEPDEGIWEVRGPKRHFTHSKVMAWVAFDRMIKEVEHWQLPGPIDRWRTIRDEIHQEVCSAGFDGQRNTFVQYYGGSSLDASLLMLPLVGFLPCDDGRVAGTVAAIQRELMVDGFVKRYPTTEAVDGLPHGEGAFIPCTLWLADCLALLGQLDEAKKLFERVVGLCNELGLLSEEYDPQAQRMLGNFPQAFSHVGIINTAQNLTRAAGPASHRLHG